MYGICFEFIYALQDPRRAYNRWGFIAASDFIERLPFDEKRDSNDLQ